MHLLDSYSLQSGMKISKPFVLEKYFPLPFDKYITFQPFSKESKSYSYYLEVLRLLVPILEKENIKIVQLGASGESVFDGVFSTVGKTSIGNVGYLVQHALLHFGADSVATHLAGFYDIPLVGLYAANYTECVKPYFGTQTKQILLEGDRHGKKPTFSFQENPKTIDSIKPETIVQSICDLLNIQFKPVYETVLINPFYNHKIIETIPNQMVNVQQLGVDAIVMRMDVLFDENCLIQQSQQSKVVIITSSPLSPSYLQTFKSQIKEVHYEIKNSYCLPFICDLLNNGIKINMFSYLTNDDLSQIRLELMDFGIIWQKKVKYQLDYTELKNIAFDQLYYKSNKFTLSAGKIYPSLESVKLNRPIKHLIPVEVKVPDSPDWWKESEFCYFSKLN